MHVLILQWPPPTPPILMSLVSNIWLILSQSCCDCLFHCVCLVNLVKTITVASSAHYITPTPDGSALIYHPPSAAEWWRGQDAGSTLPVCLFVECKPTSTVSTICFLIQISVICIIILAFCLLHRKLQICHGNELLAIMTRAGWVKVW